MAEIPQQGACKLTLNVKEGIIQEALEKLSVCSGMTHSLPWLLKSFPARLYGSMNTDLVCDAINTAMRELSFKSFTDVLSQLSLEGGLIIGAGLEDLGKGLRSQVGTLYGTLAKGPRYLEMAEGYIKNVFLWIRTMKSAVTNSFTWVSSWTKSRKGTDANRSVETKLQAYGRVTEEQGAVK